ncbi:alpha/beta hydrolase [Nocardia heshunensis]
MLSPSIRPASARLAVTAVLSVLTPFVVAAGHPAAAPDSDRLVHLQVHSAAMGKDVTVDVQRPADTAHPAPTLYLLNGAGGGEDAATWEEQTDALSFLADKHVNVVVPIGGKWSYYTDWRDEDPVLGVNKWSTFLTRELPPVIDRMFATDGVNAIAGLSASATSVLQLPISAPGLYRAAAAYSGCAQISDPVGRAFAVTVISAGGGTASNMYGPAGDPMWAANDPYVHADQLRGLKLFISSGTGVPGRYDTLDNPRLDGQLATLLDQDAVGGTLEAAVNWCTHNLADRLDTLDIPATVDFQPTGTHSWGYWQDELKTSWPVLAAGLGLPE